MKSGSELAGMCRRAKEHTTVIGGVIALLVLLCALLFPFTPMNQTITIVFEKNLPTGASGTVTAEFSDRSATVKTQKMQVSGRYLTYHPDPLTYDAQSLRFRLSGIGDDAIVRVDAEVNSQGRHWWTVHRLSLDQLSVRHSANATLVTLSHDDMQNMVKGWEMWNPGRLALVAMVLVGIAIVSIRRFALPSVPLPWFSSSVVVILLTIMGAWRVWIIDASLRSRIMVIGILLGFLVLAGLNVVTAVGGRMTDAVIVIDYCSVLVVALGQGILYVLKWSHSPDEIAHLSYVAWEKAYRQLIPDFANMRIYKTVFNGYADFTHPIAFNQLGHPPLYYLLMSLVPGMYVNGTTVTYHLAWLRMASLIILLAGLALCAYILYTRLPHVPVLHLVAALGLIACPNMVQVSAGVNNDSLCLLTATMTIWGVIRFTERRYDWKTYTLVAVGLSATLLTKLTAGMVMALLCAFVCIAAVMDVSARKVLMMKSFWGAMTALILPLAYYAVVFIRYRSIQPSYQQFDPQGYRESTFYTPMSERLDWNIFQYVDYYITQFLRTWWSIPWQDDLPRSGVTAFDTRTIALTLLLLVPFALLFVGRKERSRMDNLLVMGLSAIVVTILYQFRNAMGGFYTNGYTGGLQSRYYLCAMLVLVYALCNLLQRWFLVPAQESSVEVRMSYIGMLICAAFSMMLVWDGLLQPFLLQPVGMAALS